MWGRRWKEDGDQVQLGVQMAHALCAAGEPALADSPSLGSALGTFSTLPRALVLVVCSCSPYPQGCDLWPEVKITP